MDERLDMAFFDKLTESTKELFWVKFTIGDMTQELPYVLIPKEEKPPLKLTKMPEIKNGKDNESTRKSIEDDIKGNMFDYFDYQTYLDDTTSIYLEMINRGVDKTNWTKEQKKTVKDGMSNMQRFYPNLFGMITLSIQKDMEERTKLFLGGQETPK